MAYYEKLGDIVKYNIEYDNVNKYVKACIEDEIELRYLKQFYSDLADVLRKHNCKKALTDLRSAMVNMTIIEIDELPNLASEIGFDALIKRALVVSDNFKKYSFFESISNINRQNMKIFRSFSEAEEWLLNDEKAPNQAIPGSSLTIDEQG